MCGPLEQAGKEREWVKEREKGEPYTRIPDSTVCLTDHVSVTICYTRNINIDWDSNGFLGDVDSDVESPSEPFFKSPEARRWIEWPEQEAVALRMANVCSLGSFPASLDAGKESSSSSDRGEWGHPSGDGDLEVSAGTGAGNVGSRCAGVLGLCVPPSDDEVELLLFFALSSRAPPSPVFE